MNIKQKQHLLAYLGYYVGAVDGDWGTLSKTACTAFQKDFGGITVDGFAGPETEKAMRHAVAYGMPARNVDEPAKDINVPSTGTFWDEIEFFDRSEFKCTCGGRGCTGYPAEPRERLVRNADSARKHFGLPAIVSSGVRCTLRNSELPGSAANSLHLTGRAMDIGIPGVSAVNLKAYLLTLPEVHECYEIDECYVHMGIQKY